MGGNILYSNEEIPRIALNKNQIITKQMNQHKKSLKLVNFFNVFIFNNL